MRTINELLTSLGIEPLKKKDVTALITSLPMVGQSFL